MIMIKGKTYFYLFGFLFLIILLTRILYDYDTWRILLLFLFPISLCFLLWGQKKYSVKNRVYSTIGVCIVSILFWYDFSFLSWTLFIPFLSGGVALLTSYFVSER